MRAIMIAALALTACGPDESAANQPRERGARGCADGLTVKMDRGSFDHLGAGKNELDRWSKDSGQVFTAAAGALCRDKKLDLAELGKFSELLVQYGAGADSPVVWEDIDRPGSIILQYAFSPGSPAPDQAEVRDAIICWNDSDEAICADRLP